MPKLEKVGKKLRSLIESAANLEMQDRKISNMSDSELCKQAEQMGLEKSIVKDGEGNLTADSRNELIAALQQADNHSSSSDLNEDDDDKAAIFRDDDTDETEVNSENDEQFYVWDNGGSETEDGTLDRYTILLKSDIENPDRRGMVPVLSSGDNPKTVSGHESIYLRDLDGFLSDSQEGDNAFGKLIPFSSLPKEVQNFALSDYAEELERSQEQNKELVKEATEGDVLYAVKSGKNNKFLNTLFSDDPKKTFSGKSADKDAYKWRDSEIATRIANGWQGKAMDAVVVSVKFENGKWEEVVPDLDESLKEDETDKNDEEVDDTDEKIDADDVDNLINKDKEEDSLDSENADSDADSDEESEEEEVEKITVVVVSPELKKDTEDDDDFKEEMSSSYDTDLKMKDRKDNGMKEHVDMLHAGESLSEEFKEKSRLIFETALNKELAKIQKTFDRKLKLKEAKLEKEFSEKLKVAQEKLIEEQAQLIDGYLAEAIDVWVNENKLALEASIKTELTEEFIDRLKNLFLESYIEVPAERFDLVKAQEQKINELQEALNKNKEKTLHFIKENKKLQCQQIVENATSTMTKIDKVKFVQLLESVDFNSFDDFEKKVKTLKESFTAKKSSQKEHIAEKTRVINSDVRVISPTPETTPTSLVKQFLDKQKNIF